MNSKNRMDDKNQETTDFFPYIDRSTSYTSSPDQMTIVLGADVAEGYRIEWETEDDVQKAREYRSRTYDFTSMALGLETPQQLGERLAAQIITMLDTAGKKPSRIACDLYPKFPTTYAAEVLSEHYDVPTIRMQKCHREILDAAEAGRHVLGICLDDLSYGSDGTLWGGEVLDIREDRFTRLASIHPYQLIGTNMELHSSTPWQTAVSMLYDLARISHNEDEAIRDFVAKQEASEKVHHLDLCSLNDARAQYIAQDRNKNTTRSTAASGLFDAVVAILGLQRVSTPTGRTSMEALAEAAEVFGLKCEKRKNEISTLYRKLEKLISAAEEMDDPTLEPGDLWEDTDDGAFSEEGADDNQDILHTEQLIQLLADERIRYLSAYGKRNYDRPLNLKKPDTGDSDENSQMLAWFFLDALATILRSYCEEKKAKEGYDGIPIVLAGHFLKSESIRNHLETKMMLSE